MYRIREEQHVAQDVFLGHIEHGQPLIDVYVTAQSEVVQDKEGACATVLHIGEGMHFHLGPLAVLAFIQILTAVANPDAMANELIEDHAEQGEPLSPEAAAALRETIRQQIEHARVVCAEDNDEWKERR